MLIRADQSDDGSKAIRHKVPCKISEKCSVSRSRNLRTGELRALKFEFTDSTIQEP